MSIMTVDTIADAMRAGLLIVSRRGGGDPGLLAKAASTEMLTLGFLVDPSVLPSDRAELSGIVSAARRAARDDVPWQPMFPDFPDQVRDMPVLDRVVHQLLHYLSDGRIIPDPVASPRADLPLEDMVRGARPLEVVTPAEAAHRLVRSLVRSSTSAPDHEVSLASRLVGVIRDRDEVLSEIAGAVNRENAAALLSACRQWVTCDDMVRLLDAARHPDMVLRIMAVMYSSASSGKDAQYASAVASLSDSLASSVRFASVPRRVRRAVVRAAGRLSGGFRVDLFLARVRLWRRLLRSIHSFDHASSPESRRALDIIHGNVTHRTFASVVEEAIAAGDVVAAARLIVSEGRPGVLVRRFGELLDKAASDAVRRVVIGLVAEHGSGAPVATLISARNGLSGRSSNRIIRMSGRSNITLGGSQTVSDAVMAEALAAIDEAIAARVSGMDAPEVFGAPEFPSTPVAVYRRDAADADRSVVRGQRIPLGINVGDPGVVVRAGIRWGDDMDLDLSVVLVRDWEESTPDVLGWDSPMYYDRDAPVVHSGDVVCAGSEFVDLHVARLRGMGVRWAVFAVHVYRGREHLSGVDHDFAVMVRSDGQAGRVFDPASAPVLFTTSQRSLFAVFAVVDLDDGEVIVVDSSGREGEMRGSSYSDVGSVMEIAGDALRDQFTYGQFADMVARAHGATVSDTEVVPLSFYDDFVR